MVRRCCREGICPLYLTAQLLWQGTGRRVYVGVIYIGFIGGTQREAEQMFAGTNSYPPNAIDNWRSFAGEDRQAACTERPTPCHGAGLCSGDRSM